MTKNTRTTALVSATAAALAATVLAWPAPAAAQPDDVGSLKANVLLVMDTSREMEFLADGLRHPTCRYVNNEDRGAARTNPAERTRWMLLQDALLGPIPDAAWSCGRFDPVAPSCPAAEGCYWDATDTCIENVTVEQQCAQSPVGSTCPEADCYKRSSRCYRLVPTGATQVCSRLATLTDICIPLDPTEVCRSGGHGCDCETPAGVQLRPPRPFMPEFWDTSLYQAFGPRLSSAGILERFKSVIRFGYSALDSYYDDAILAQGMWSYDHRSSEPHDVRPFLATDPWAREQCCRQTCLDAGGTFDACCGAPCSRVDVGLRNSHESGLGIGFPGYGSFVGWGRATGGSADYRADSDRWSGLYNELAQPMRGGGRPFAAALTDIYSAYCGTDASPTTASCRPNFGDTMATPDACYERFIILVTSGMPAMGDGTIYPTSETVAAWLHSIGGIDAIPSGGRISLYVIGFLLPAAGTTEGDAIRVKLQGIADAGCPTGHGHCLNPSQILEAYDTASLMAAFTRIIGKITTTTTTRTLPITTSQIEAADTPSGATAEVVQYQFNSALDVAGLDNGMWTGLLERVAYECNAAGDVVVSTDPTTYVDYAQVLRQRVATGTGRNLKTVTDDAPTGGMRYTPFPTSVALEDLDEATVSAADLGCSGEECTGTDAVAYVDRIVDFMHADETAPLDRKTYPLADIFHANVQIVGRPNLDLPIASYFLFQEAQFGRTQVAYAATNDGILHAFRVNNPASSSVGTKGEELWGFTPNHLLPQLKYQAASGHVPNLDSSPVVRDVRLFRDATGSSTGDAAWGWHTVLLGGYREGGRGYYALDVTTPELDAGGAGPKLLWEISNTTEDTGNGTPNDYANLWQTWGAPAVGTVFVRNRDLTGSPLGELSVAFLPGGRIDPGTDGVTDLYVVSTKTGRLIQKLTPTFPTDTPYNHCVSASVDCSVYPQCCAQLIGTPVAYGAVAGTVTTRVFVGDDRGRLWRADVSSQDPEDWTLQLFYPHPALAAAGEPLPPTTTLPEAEYAPTLALDNQNRVVVIYGTGRTDDLGGTAANYMFSLTEEFSCPTTGTGACTARAHVNWMVTLQGFLTSLGYRGGEILTGQPVVFNNTVYFTTFAPNPGECTMGEGRIWALHYTDQSTDAWVGVTCGTGGDRVTGALYCAYPNTYIAGLNVIQRPSCIDDTALLTPGLGSSTTTSRRDRFELVAQVGNAGGLVSTSSPQQVPTISMEVPAPTITTLTDSWGLVFE